MKPVVLCILDGVGIRKEIHGNAVKKANMPNFNYLYKKYSHSLLEASGKQVGLPENQMGNSEVGHANIGAGRIVYQPLEIINNSIINKTFFSNENILRVINHSKKNNSKLHICGLLSDGGVHSHIDHLISLIDMCKENNIQNLYLHLFLDGRDTKRDNALTYLKLLEEKIKETSIGKIASISGRYYAMDRDNRWDRVQKAYNAMVLGTTKIEKNYEKIITDSYNNEVYDEFIEPFIVEENGLIENNDGIIVFNYRPDRLREIFKAITDDKFSSFETLKLDNIKLATMFPVSEEVKCINAFEHQNLENTFGAYIEKFNLHQLRIAETEKYAHVTYFFDGGKEVVLKNKNEILIPSPKVATYDLQPEMSANKITETLLKEMDKNIYDVIILNYANGDMVGHTGNMEATIKALEVVDVCLGKLYKKTKEKNGVLIITADHGNSDFMLDENDKPITTHSISKVPFIITNYKCKLKDGKLSDIAPTMLEIMNLDKPEEMTGESLIEKETKKSKSEKVFIICSLIFLITLFSIYTIRFLKYYREENPIISEEITDTSLVSKILKKEIVTSGDGLYQDGNEYIFKGNVENNYIYYSGILFRIVKINSNKTIKLITDDVISSIVWGTGNYETSYIRNYLNDNELENTGIFYNVLNNPDDYIYASKFCVNKIDINTGICGNTVTDKIGLLTYQEYKEALGNESYLNISKYWWLSNTEENKPMYVFTEGGINSNSVSENTYYSYGVRPVFNLKASVNYISGTGTKEDPYVFDNQNNIKIGDYVSYSDYTWKVIKVDDNKIKLATSDYIKVSDEYITKKYSNNSNSFSLDDKTSLAYYLNNNFYNSLNNQKIIVDGTWYTGNYNENNNYDYQEIFKSSIEAKVGLLNVIDLFINDLADYDLMTPNSEDMIYNVKNDGSLGLSLITDEFKIRPSIYIDKNVSLTGDGTIDNPFIIE